MEKAFVKIEVAMHSRGKVVEEVGSGNIETNKGKAR